MAKARQRSGWKLPLLSAALVMTAMVGLIAVSDSRSQDSTAFLSEISQEYSGNDIDKLRDLVEKLKVNLEQLKESSSNWQEAVAKKAKKEKLSLGTLSDVSQEVDGAEEKAERFLRTPGGFHFASIHLESFSRLLCGIIPQWPFVSHSHSGPIGPRGMPGYPGARVRECNEWSRK
eukprot:738348-Hanusia_phi.AAC.3